MIVKKVLIIAYYYVKEIVAVTFVILLLIGFLLKVYNYELGLLFTIIFFFVLGLYVGIIITRKAIHFLKDQDKSNNDFLKKIKNKASQK